jgi:hypothetical protein
MSSLKQAIVERFLADLGERKLLDENTINALRKLLAENPKIKADDFVKVFAGYEDDVT